MFAVTMLHCMCCYLLQHCTCICLEFGELNKCSTSKQSVSDNAIPVGQKSSREQTSFALFCFVLQYTNNTKSVLILSKHSKNSAFKSIHYCTQDKMTQ